MADILLPMASRIKKAGAPTNAPVRVQISVGGRRASGEPGPNCSLSKPLPEANVGDRTRCLLLFSGGRDSTLAALRLLQRFPGITLVTVTSDHLTGTDAVFKRLTELRPHIPGNTRHILVRQMPHRGYDDLIAATCLPCHRAYILTGMLLASHFGTPHLALGYAGYQREWPEQSEYATSALRDLLKGLGFVLHLPTYDLRIKAAAMDELDAYGLTRDALEQKCSKQITNVELPLPTLVAEVRRWTNAIATAASSMTIDDLVVLSHAAMDSLRERDGD